MTKGSIVCLFKVEGLQQSHILQIHSMENKNISKTQIHS